MSLIIHCLYKQGRREHVEPEGAKTGQNYTYGGRNRVEPDGAKMGQS